MGRKLWSPSAQKWVAVETLPSGVTSIAKARKPKAETHERPPGTWGIIDNIPWLQKAFNALRKHPTALAVAVVLQMHYVLRGKHPIPLTNAMLVGWGINRKAKIRALRTLEAAGLIAVEWCPRKAPVVTVLQP
jgi:hypothetical protein